jgi:hypothetical protein
VNDLDALIARIVELTGLNDRAAQVIASALGDGEHTSGAIVAKATEMGYELPDEKKPKVAPGQQTHDAHVTMDPARVLDEVYMVMPRVLCANMPTIGKAPNEAYEHFSELIEQLPDEVRALLVKLDLYEGKATFWLRDEANDVDRPIGPIDLRGLESAEAIEDAFLTLMGRLNKVISADFN